MSKKYTFKELRSSRRAPIIATYIGLFIGAVIMMFPFLWALSSSLQGPGLAYVKPVKFFAPPFEWSNYAKVFQKMNFLAYFKNSGIIAIFVVAGEVLSSSFIGFGFAKYKFKGSGFMWFCLLGTMMLPANILIIPLYQMWNTVGGLDTYLPLTVPFFFGRAFNIFLMRQCFMSLPGALYEAAIMDGANPFKIYARIYLPLAKPTLITIAVTAFMHAWNNMFDPLIYITSIEKYPVSLGLTYVKNAFEYNTELLMAASMIAMAPILAVYIFAQKYFVGGVSAGAVKG